MPSSSHGHISTRHAILTGWLLCGVLDITAACLQAWTQAGRAPADVLRGVASALWGAAAMKSGAGMAAIGCYAIEDELGNGTLAVLDLPRWRLARTIAAVTARDVPLTTPAQRFWSCSARSCPAERPREAVAR